MTCAWIWGYSTRGTVILHISTHLSLTLIANLDLTKHHLQACNFHFKEINLKVELYRIIQVFKKLKYTIVYLFLSLPVAPIEANLDPKGNIFKLHMSAKTWTGSPKSQITCSCVQNITVNLTCTFASNYCQRCKSDLSPLLRSGPTALSVTSAFSSPQFGHLLFCFRSLIVILQLIWLLKKSFNTRLTFCCSQQKNHLITSHQKQREEEEALWTLLKITSSPSLFISPKDANACACTTKNKTAKSCDTGVGVNKAPFHLQSLGADESIWWKQKVGRSCDCRAWASLFTTVSSVALSAESSPPRLSSSLLFVTFNPSHPGLSSTQMIRCPQRSKSKHRLICSNHVQSQKGCTISLALSLSLLATLPWITSLGGIKCDSPVLAAPTLVQQSSPLPSPPQQTDLPEWLQITCRFCRSCAGHRNQGLIYFIKRCSQQTWLELSWQLFFCYQERQRTAAEEKRWGWRWGAGDCSWSTLSRESSPEDALQQIRQRQATLQDLEKKVYVQKCVRVGKCAAQRLGRAVVMDCRLHFHWVYFSAAHCCQQDGFNIVYIFRLRDRMQMTNKVSCSQGY